MRTYTQGLNKALKIKIKIQNALKEVSLIKNISPKKLEM